MARTGFIHHIGSFLLFASFILLLIASVSAPHINSLGFLRVYTKSSTQNSIRATSASYGSFGYCYLDASNGGGDACSGAHIGYDIGFIQNELDGTNFGRASQQTIKGLTNVFVLHPVACAVVLLAFAFSIGAGFVGSFAAAITGLIGWVLTFVVMVIDFIVFGTVKDHANGKDGTGSKARFGAAMWMVLAAFLLLIIASVILFLSCCSARRTRKEDKEAARAARHDRPKRRFRMPAFGRRRH